MTKVSGASVMVKAPPACDNFNFGTEVENQTTCAAPQRPLLRTLIRLPENLDSCADSSDIFDRPRTEKDRPWWTTTAF